MQTHANIGADTSLYQQYLTAILAHRGVRIDHADRLARAAVEKTQAFEAASLRRALDQSLQEDFEALLGQAIEMAVESGEATLGGCRLSWSRECRLCGDQEVGDPFTYFEFDAGKRWINENVGDLIYQTAKEYFQDDLEQFERQEFDPFAADRNAPIQFYVTRVWRAPRIARAVPA